MILNWQAFHRYLFDAVFYLFIKKDDQLHVEFKPIFSKLSWKLSFENLL